MFEFLLDAISDSPTTYLLLAGVIVVDDFVPFAPGDTAMITAGIVAANGGLSIPLVIVSSAAGGLLGDQRPAGRDSHQVPLRVEFIDQWQQVEFVGRASVKQDKRAIRLSGRLPNPMRPAIEG